MKSMARFLALAMIVFLVGCATSQTGGGAPAATKTSGDGKMLTDEDYKRLGIQEVNR